MDVVKCLVITAEYVVIFYLQCRNSIVRYCIYILTLRSLQIFGSVGGAGIYLGAHLSVD